MNIGLDGFQKIEAQHKKLEELMNRVCQTLKKQHRADDYGSDELSGVLTKMLEFVRFHFVEEEKLMRDCSFDGFQSHKRSHRVLLVKLVELERETFIFDESTKKELLRFLEGDFYYHITEDRKIWKKTQLGK